MIIGNAVNYCEEDEAEIILRALKIRRNSNLLHNRKKILDNSVGMIRMNFPFTREHIIRNHVTLVRPSIGKARHDEFSKLRSIYLAVYRFSLRETEIRLLVWPSSSTVTLRVCFLPGADALISRLSINSSPRDTKSARTSHGRE